MITIYGIPNCNTIKKTRSWFEQHHIPYSFHDYRKDGITREKLRAWCREVNWEKLLNRQSTSWRKLDPETQAGITTAAKAITVLLEHPTLIKRPVIEKDDSIVQVGFDEEMMEKVFL